MDIGIISIIISVSFGVVTMTTLVGSTFYWAGRMANRIDALGEKLDAQGARLDARIDEMGQRLDARIDEIGQRLDRQGERLEAHGAQLAALGAEVAVLGVRIDAMGERTDAMGERLGGRIDALTEEVSTTRRELLAAISHHEHDTDGSVRFRVPPPPA